MMTMLALVLGLAVPASASRRATVSRAVPGLPGVNDLSKMTIPTAPAATIASSAGRLPQTVLPRGYELRLSLEPESASFTGKVAIALDARVPVDRIVLNSLELDIKSVSFDGRAIDPSRVLLDPKAETATILLNKPVRGHKRLEIEYAGTMNELMRGLFRAKGAHAGRPESWAFTHLEPTHARRVLPSFDEPAFKAPFKLTMSVPAHLTPISNMPAASSKVEGGRRVVAFAQTPRMSSYLLAVFAARLVASTVMAGRTELSVWTSEDKRGQAGFALEVGKKALKALNAYFGMPYQLPKLDMVASPDFASGAMENWGAVLYRDSSLLVDRKLSSDAAKRRVAEVVTHEIVHQWFGNLVTMKWWNDLWLNEAFATWLAAKVVDGWSPGWKVWEEYDQGKRAPLSIDALPGTRPVRSEAATPAEIQAMFDPITYQKGGALLRMLEGWLGEKDFRRGLQAAMRRYQYKNFEAADLWRELERVSGKPVRRVADGWLRQPGVPTLAVSAASPAGKGSPDAGRDGGLPAASGRRLTIRQERFSAFGLKDDALWAVPVAIRYRLNGERRVRTLRVLLDQPSATVELPGKGELLWAYPNAGETGYYRLALDASLLSKALASRRELEPGERGGLLSHLWARSRAGLLPVASFLEALEAFSDDRSRLVLEESASYLKILRRELAEAPAQREAFARFAEKLLGPHAARLGWAKKKGEAPELGSARPALLDALARVAPDAAALAQAPARLEDYLREPALVDPAVAPIALALGAKANDAVLYEQFRARLGAPRTAEQKDQMLRALCEFTAPELLEKTLAMTLSDELRAQDAWKPFVFLLADPANQARTWEFVKANWKPLVDKLGPRGATRVIGAGAGLVSEPWKAELESFFSAPQNEIEMARKTLAQALESIELGLRFRRAQKDSFASWLSGGAARAGRRPARARR